MRFPLRFPRGEFLAMSFPPQALALEIWPSRSDNLLYAWRAGPRALVIDPGEAAPVCAGLAALGARAEAILLTHGHADHVEGVAEIVATFGCPVYAPAGLGLGQPVRDGDRLDFGFCALDAIASPGHTLHCLSYLDPVGGMLFCGDTLFRGGCGRPLAGTPAQLWHSLLRLAALPPETRVACGHEYTVDNLRFALAVLPGDPDLRRALDRALALRAAGRPTVPFRLGDELRENLFLRSAEPAVAAAAGLSGAPAVEVFARLRAWKSAGGPPPGPRSS
jgi:hydroxyacylglutathione hydrolase